MWFGEEPLVVIDHLQAIAVEGFGIVMHCVPIDLILWTLLAAEVQTIVQGKKYLLRLDHPAVGKCSLSSQLPSTRQSIN
jgi:hypothetical protein